MNMKSTSPTLPVVARGLTKTFRSGDVVTPALRGVDLDVHDNELMMLVGPSGCGKTTLISVLASILDQDEGELRVLGQDLRALDAAGKTAFRRHQLGFVFQSFNLIPSINAVENVAVPALLNGVPRREAMQRAEAWLEHVGLAERRHHRPSELSGGQQQRVAIARALIHEPHLVVCDEPTSALDHRTGEQIMDMMRDVALKPGRAIVVVTHDSRIFRYADRIAEMDDGRVIRLDNRGASSTDLTETRTTP
jgi:putative ABC transport system ATP-binding protein